MKIKSLLLALLCAFTITLSAQTTKVLGGDLSLVPAYEAAGDVWLDADGNSINTTYNDGMLGFVKEKAKWNSVRVRLLVDPTQDSFVATCQDLEYVKKLGKRIKDAGMNFLLDIFYSDTWADVSKQWIPASWGYDRNTETATLAAKVKSYTTEVLNALVDYGAKPDYIQLGNEVSYGMLWDSATVGSKRNYFITSGTYEGQQTPIERFANLLKAAAEGVRASNASTAKIVLHCERVGNGVTAVNNFYTWVGKAGFTDYDVIGLSYYPQWHGTIANLKGVITNLTLNFPSKKIQIVETGYKNDGSETDYTPAGQATFLTDLITMLNGFNDVDGLYYWQPEECGNGADDSGTNRVMDAYDSRGFWSRSWKSSQEQHTLIGAASITAMMTFIGETPDEDESQGTEVTDFENLDFENGTSNYKWTVNWNQGWSTNWFFAPDQWVSSLVTGSWFYKTWIDANKTLTAGNLIYQSKDNMPAGTYTISAAIHNESDAIYLFANDDKVAIPVASSWSNAQNVSVQTTLTEAGTLTFGITVPETVTTTAEVSLYADNFKVTYVDTSVNNITMDEDKAKDNRWYNLSGQRISEPKTKGIYINNGRKVVVK